MNKEVMNNRREEIDQMITALAVENAQIEQLRDSIKTQVLENVFSGMELIEGTELAINQRSVQLINKESGYDLAKLTIEKEYVSFSSLERKTVINFRFNGGSTEEVKFLSTMADFIKVASSNEEFIIQEFDKAQDFMSDVSKENNSEIRILEREDSAIRTSIINEVEDKILDQMKSEKGFDLVSTKINDPEVEDPYINRDSLKVNFNWTINSLSNVKIVDMTKSGKTATVEISQVTWTGDTHTFTERVRMDNIQSLITRQRRKMEDVERGDKVFA